MSREHGFSFLEMMVSVAVLSVVSVLAGAMALSTTRTNDLAGEYADDVRGLRRALRNIEEDLRGARDLTTSVDSLRVETSTGPVEYRLESGVLRRRTASRWDTVAKRIDELSAHRSGDVVRVVVGLAPRAQPNRRGPRVTTTVRLRNGGRR